MPQIPESLVGRVYSASPFGTCVCRMIRNAQDEFVDYIHLELNDAVEKNTGFKPEQLISKKASELVNRELLEKLVENYGTVVSSMLYSKSQDA